MIYIQIKELIQANKAQFGRKITLNEVSAATGISRMTLFRMMKNNGYNTLTDHLDKLCAFFECEIHQLVKYVPDAKSADYEFAA
jgi:putative transcriptional regulator